MGGKKADTKKSKGASDVDEVGLDPAILNKNYVNSCKVLDISPNEDLLEIIRAEDPPVQISVDASLGSPGTIALVNAILGTGEGLDGKPYKLINTIRLWRASVGDDGIRSIAELLRCCGNIQMNLVFLQLLDCDVSAQACKYLGNSLQSGVNNTLLTLNLDYNENIGSLGLKYLTEGICSNGTLKRLSLNYCGITSEGGRSIKNILNGFSSQLEEFNLKGNPIGGSGLLAFAKSLGKNKMLKAMDLSDTDIGPDTDALLALCDAMRENTTLIQLKFDENHIGPKGAQVLFDSGVFDKKTDKKIGDEDEDQNKPNTTLKEFLVDYNMPAELFTALLRSGGGGGKKGKKGGKKKKK